MDPGFCSAYPPSCSRTSPTTPREKKANIGFTLYSSCVAHQSNILSECTSTTSAASQASSLASLILPKINHTKPERLTYTHGSNQIHYMAESASDHPNHPSAGGLTFLVVADAALGRQVPFDTCLRCAGASLPPFPRRATTLPTCRATAPARLTARSRRSWSSIALRVAARLTRLSTCARGLTTSKPSQPRISRA